MSRKIIRLVAMLSAVASVMVAPGVASADYTDYYWNWDFTSSVFGARHTLSYNQALGGSYVSECVNALNDTGTSWVTSTVCGNQPAIAFCACALRYPWAGYTSSVYFTAFSGYR